MKNLEKFGVQELSLQESIEVNGGSKILIFAAGVTIGMALYAARR